MTRQEKVGSAMCVFPLVSAETDGRAGFAFFQCTIGKDQGWVAADPRWMACTKQEEWAGLHRVHNYVDSWMSPSPSFPRPCDQPRPGIRFGMKWCVYTVQYVNSTEAGVHVYLGLRVRERETSGISRVA